MDDGGLSSLAILFILLTANAFLSLGYYALINADSAELADRAAAGRRRAGRALALSEQATELLNTYQLVQMILRFLSAGLAAIGIAPPVAVWFGSLGMTPLGALLLAEVLILLGGVVLMLVVGTHIPAALGAYFADEVAIAFAGVLGLLVRIFWPVAAVLRGVSDALIRGLGIQARVRNITEEEIMTLVDAGQEDGIIENKEKEMIYSIFQLADTAVREVMVPRPDIVAVPVKTPLNEVVQTVLAAGHSRIPVYEGNIDHIRGLLYAKDLLSLWDRSSNGDALADLLRPTYFVPEGKAARALLQEMQQRRVHLAIVVDEYGGTAGLVTLEDLIEEIIGEVRDEYDINETAAYQRVSDDEYICNARLDLDDLNHLLDVTLPTDDNDTLGGYIFDLVGEVPEPGHVIETDQVRLEVLTVDQRRIGQVRVVRLTPVEDTEASAEEGAA